MDTTDKDIVFDKDGVCNHCHEYKKKEKERVIEKTWLPFVYENIRRSGEGKAYDCLLGLSGGVDSSMCLHYLVQNGIRPLVFSIDNGWNNPNSDENIMRMAEGLKVPFYRYIINLERFRELQMAFIKSGVKNLEIPTDHIITAAMYEVALQHDIKYIISGGNLATEGIMPESYGYHARDLYHIKAIYKIFNKKKLNGLPMMGLFKHIYYRCFKKIKTINLLDYYTYKRDEAKKILQERYGWKDYGDKHCESIFTQWFQNWYLPTKWNIDKRKPHYSSMILSGQMKREDALQRMLEPLEYPKLSFEDKVMKYPKKEYYEYPNSEKVRRWFYKLVFKPMKKIWKC